VSKVLKAYRDLLAQVLKVFKAYKDLMELVRKVQLELRVPQAHRELKAFRV
jgi:hypothetical protein